MTTDECTQPIEEFCFAYAPEDVAAANRLVNAVSIWRVFGTPLVATVTMLILVVWKPTALLTGVWCGVALTSSLYCYLTLRSVKKAQQKAAANTAVREYHYRVYADCFTVTVTANGQEHSRYTVRPRQIPKVWEDGERYVWQWDDRFLILKKSHLQPDSLLHSYFTHKP